MGEDKGSSLRKDKKTTHNFSSSYMFCLGFCFLMPKYKINKFQDSFY